MYVTATISYVTDIIGLLYSDVNSVTNLNHRFV